MNQTYSLNMIPGGNPLRIPIRQYDAGMRVIVLTLWNGSAVFTPPTGASVTVDGTKADGKSFSYNASVSGADVTFPITAQMAAVAGTVRCQLTVTKSGSILGSATFLLEVEPSALPGDPDLSQSELSALEQLRQDARSAASSAASSASAASASAAAASATVTGKADKKVPAAAGNIATLDASGNLADSGKQPTPEGIGAEPIGYASAGAYYGNVLQINAQRGGAWIAMNTTVWFDSNQGTTSLPANGEGSGFATLTGSGVDGGGVLTLHYTNGCTAQRVLSMVNGALSWGEWEWVNPPMESGIEYRTVERYNGKPVYQLALNLGAMTSGANVRVAPQVDIIDWAGLCGKKPIPGQSNSIDPNYYIGLNFYWDSDGTHAIYRCGSGESGNNVQLRLKYAYP